VGELGLDHLTKLLAGIEAIFRRLRRRGIGAGNASNEIGLQQSALDADGIERNPKIPAWLALGLTGHYAISGTMT
jgi:hypothetical protein